MIKKNIKNNKGFVLLFTMLLCSIILVIALGISSIALKETKFSISARATNEAFFAADAGAECALINDKTDPSLNPFLNNNVPLFCGDYSNQITVNSLGNKKWGFRFTGLGNSGNGCADVVITKEDPVTFVNTIVSKGYNNCSVSNNVERQLEVSYY